MMRLLLILLIFFISGMDTLKAYIYTKEFYDYLERNFDRTAFAITNNDPSNTQNIRLFGGFNDALIPTKNFINTGNDIAVNLSPQAAAVNDNNTNLYISNANSDNVSVIDVNNNIIATVAVGDNPSAIAFNPVNNNIYCANPNDDTVSVINSSNVVIATVTVGDNPVGVAVNIQSGNVYVSNSADGTVSVINPSNSVIATITVGSSPRQGAFNSQNQNIYIPNFADDTVSVINTSNTVIATLAVGDEPIACGYNPINNRIYVSNSGDNDISTINADNTVNSATISVTSPQNISFNSLSESVIVASLATDALTFIGVDDRISQTVTVGDAPRAGVFNSANRTVYAVNSLDDDISVLEPIATIETSRGDVDYEFLNTSASENALLLHHVKLILPAGSQIDQRTDVVYRDGSNKFDNVSYALETYITSLNTRNIIEFFDLRGLKLDGFNSIEFDLLAATTVSVVLYYRQIDWYDLYLEQKYCSCNNLKS